MQDYTKLQVWRRARELSVSVHEVTRAFPPHAAPGLRAQIMRAVMSIATNIAEGAGRESRVDFARFITIAIASTSEVEHHLGVCADFRLIDDSIASRLADRCNQLRRMLFALRRALIERERDNSRSRSGPPAGADTTATERPEARDL